MNRFCSIFSQLLQLFPRTEFEQAVKSTRAERHARGFSCWGQFVAMLFCQLGRAHSIREITGGLRSCEGKLKHLGISAPSRSTLAYAGAKPLRPPIPGIDQKNVINALDLLRGAKDATGKVVVLGGGHVGAEVAEYLV